MLLVYVFIRTTTMLSLFVYCSIGIKNDLLVGKLVFQVIKYNASMHD